MKFFFSTPLGLDVGLGVSKKQSVGAVIGAGISAIGSLLGNQMQNNANSNLNRENQLFQSGMLHEQQNWSEKMWNKENEYNTPLAQRERLREAGFNPWISGSGGSMSNVSQTPASQGSTPAPQSMPMRYDNPFQNLGNTINDMVRSNAESANQLSQAAQNAVNTAVALYEKTGDIEAAQRYLATTLKSVGGANFTDDSLYFQQLNLTIHGMELKNIGQELANTRSELENQIVAKYGAKEAESRIANLEQLTTKYVGELGLMSSQADLNRSEINLNDKRAYELGARAAAEFAQAGLFTSEANINNGMANFLIGNARISYIQSYMNAVEQSADFIGNEKVRETKMSDFGKSRRDINYKNSPEGNAVNSFINGFTNAAKVNVGVNYSNGFNVNRNFTTGHTNSMIFNGNQWYSPQR